MSAVPQAITLPDPPTDGITNLHYLSDSLLASSSWDGAVRVHHTTAGAEKLQYSHATKGGPLLSMTTLSDHTLVTGGLDGSIRFIDVTASSSAELIVGRQGEDKENNARACACLAATTAHQADTFVSAGWNRKLHLWDVRDRRKTTPVRTVDLPGKAFAVDVRDHLVVLATSGRRTCWVDLRSVEGRVAVESVPADVATDAASKKIKYAFKCHRIGDTVYPVNDICFHPKHTGTFATGGCDGGVVLWDGHHKKKLLSLPSLPTSIAAVAFSPDGSQLAMASSYTFEDGEREHPRDEIYIREMLEEECRPKKRE